MTFTSDVETQSAKKFHISAAVNWEENSQPEVINEDNTFEDDWYYEKCVVQNEKMSNKCIYNAFLIYSTLLNSESLLSKLHLLNNLKTK